jgi:hypothetical protein
MPGWETLLNNLEQDIGALFETLSLRTKLGVSEREIAVVCSMFSFSGRHLSKQQPGTLHSS